MIYKIQLSTKESININEAEYKKFKENIGSTFLEFENGIINPSFVVSITIDREASKEEVRLLERSRNNLLEEPEKDTNQIKHYLEKYKPEFIKERESLKNNEQKDEVV